MANAALTVSGLVMSFFAWQIALTRVEVAKVAALMTTLALWVTGASYASLGLWTACLSVLTSALAWTVITWKVTYGKT